METLPKFKVAICGAGVGGLTLAAFISRNPEVEVVVYEAKPQVSAIGEGIAIWKRSWQVLQDMGLDEELAKRNFPPPKEGEVRGPIYRKSDQPEDGYDFHSHLMPYGPLNVPRPKLLDMLQVKLGPNCKLFLSKRVVDYSLDGINSQVSITFSDGSTDSADILIGADGVHSTIRKLLFTGLARQDPSNAESYLSHIPPKWSGTYAYRCNVSADALRARYPDHRSLGNPYIWCGQDNHVVSYPFGSMVHFICYRSVPGGGGGGGVLDGPHVIDVPKEQVLESFKDWEPELWVMLELMNPNPSRWSIFVVDPIPLSVSGRIALSGDSAHAMTPHQGVGGGQAIEDAHLLGRLLAHPKATKENLPGILKIYQGIRLPFAQKTAERSRLNGLMYEFNHPDFPVNSASSREEMHALGEAVGETFGWLAKGGCDEDWRNAEEQLNRIAT